MLPGAGLSGEELAWLRMIFDRFDGNKDGNLEMKEMAALLRNCFPSRAADAKKLMGEVKKADLNKDGLVSFQVRPDPIRSDPDPIRPHPTPPRPASSHPISIPSPSHPHPIPPHPDPDPDPDPDPAGVPPLLRDAARLRS